MWKQLLGIYFLLGNSILSFAQGLPIVEFGIISTEEQAMGAPEYAPEAAALVLYHGWDSKVLDNRTWGFSQRRHRRIKIFKSSAFSLGSIELTFNPSWEKIDQIEAIIHLPSGQQIELPRSAFFNGDASDELEFLSFSFPQVQVGAILEYRYRYQRKSIIYLPKMVFQEEIPVRFCEYVLASERRHSYRAIGPAMDELEVATLKENRSGDYSTLRHYHFARRNIPPFKEEAYSVNTSDYIASIQIEKILPTRYSSLNSFIESQETGVRNRDWNSAAVRLMNSPDFGERILVDGRRAKFLKEVGIILGESDHEKIQNILDFVNDRLDWNGHYDIFSDTPLKEVWENGLGNSAQLNMILLNILLDNNFDAHPLLVGLRGNGKPILEAPLLRQFQHFMVVVLIEDEYLVLDANGEYSIAGLPRPQSLNYYGWKVHRADSEWIPLKVPAMRIAIFGEVVLSLDGTATVNAKARLHDYFALNARAILEDISDDSQGPIISDIIERHPSADLTDYRTDIPEAPTKPVNIELDCQLTLGQTFDDLIYFNPILFNFLEEGLVEDVERQFPIEFEYPWQGRQIIKVNLPDGYVIDELPESIRMVSDDESIDISFQCIPDADERIINVNFGVTIKENFYPVESYEGLRELFEGIVNLQEATIVLRKME